MGPHNTTNVAAQVRALILQSSMRFLNFRSVGNVIRCERCAVQQQVAFSKSSEDVEEAVTEGGFFIEQLEQVLHGRRGGGRAAGCRRKCVLVWW